MDRLLKEKKTAIRLNDGIFAVIYINYKQPACKTQSIACKIKSTLLLIYKQLFLKFQAPCL